MPFNELKHRPSFESFPPTVMHLTHMQPHSQQQPNTNKPLPPKPVDLDLDLDIIDANPISFFLTVPTPDDDDDESIDYFEGDDYDIDNDVFDEDLSAGIEGSEEDLRAKEVREVSPSSLQRETLDAVAAAKEDLRLNDGAVDERPLLDRDFEDDLVESEVEFGFAMPLSLKDFVGRAGGAQRGVITSLITEARDIDAGRSSRAGHRIPSPSSSPPPRSSRAFGFDIPEYKPKPNSTTNIHTTTNSSTNKDRGRGRVKLNSANSVNWAQSQPLSTAYLATSPPRRTSSLSPKPRKPVSWRVPSRAIWRIDEEVGEVGVLSSSAPALGGAAGSGILRNGNGGNGSVSGNGGEVKKVKKQVRWADFE